MKRIKQLICSILVVAGVSMQGQSIVPGYMGKKTFADYKVSVSPAFRRPTFLNRVSERQRSTYPVGTAESSFLPFNVTHAVTVERVMGRKFSMSFNYMFAASKEYFTFQRDVTTAGVMANYTFSHKQMNIFGHYYTGSLVFYGKNALAPYGKYFKLTAGYCSMMGKFTDTELVSDKLNGSSETVALNSDVGYYKTGAFGWGCSFGMNRIFKDRIVVNRGVSFFLPLRSEDTNDGNMSFKNVSWAISNRLHLRDIATFYLGCGYLF